MNDVTSAPFNWRAHLKVHPAADLFPLMSESELKVLAEDIRKNGLQTRIVLALVPSLEVRDVERKCILLDGRNRLDALALLGWIEPPKERRWDWYIPYIIAKDGEAPSSGPYDIVEANDDEEGHAKLFRIAASLNVNRRHLTAEQKRELIATLLKANPEQSNRSIAKQVKEDHHKVAKVRSELEATGEVSPVEKTVGADGKARKQPAKREPRADVTAERAYNDTLKITGIQKPKGRKDLEQLAKQFLTGLAQAFTKRADSLRTIVQFRDALPDDIRRQLRGSLLTIQDETGALADQLEDKPAEPTAEQTALQPTDDADAEQPETVAEQANRFHRQIFDFLIDFEPRLKSWSQSTPLTNEARECIHNALMLAADALMVMAQDIDGRSTAQIAEAA